MGALIACAAGAALALFAVALGNGLAASFWPRSALGVTALAAIVGALAGLVAAAAPGRWRALARRRAPVLLGLAGLVAISSFPALRMIAVELPAGPRLLAFPPLFAVLCAAPFAIVAGLLVCWLGAGERRRLGWLLSGAGAGWLAAAAIAGAGLPLASPWFGGHEVQAAPAGVGSTRLTVDRGLRQIAVAPASPEPLLYLPYLPARDASGGVDVLFVGWPRGQALAAVLELPQARLTVLEEDAALVAAAVERWPALKAAVGAGRARVLVGNPRWSLARLEERFGLIALYDGGTTEPYLARALSLRAEHLWTLEACRSYLAHLAPGGFLLSERTATGRVVATLREATGLPPREFLKTLVIFGERGRYRSQCWFRVEGLNDRVLRGVAAAAFRRGAPTIYIPATRGTGTFYDRLIQGDPVEGNYFSTPLDLSPVLDERPFFDDVDRVAISPVGRAMPEERASPPGQAPLVVIPPGDRGLAAVLLIGFLCACAIVAVGSRLERCAAGPGAVRRVAAPALALGACAGLALEAFAAWARWLAPSAAAAQAAAAVVPFAVGVAWLRLDRADRPDAPSPWVLGLAAALTLAAVGAYRLPFAWAGWALALAAAGALSGALLGGSLHAALRELEDELGASAAWFCGIALAAASLAWPAGRLTATHFGYRALWALAAVAALAAARSLRRAPGGRPGERPT